MAIRSFLLTSVGSLFCIVHAFGQCATSGTISSDCTTTGNLIITGNSLTVSSGVTITITGTLTVRGGGSIIATGATVNTGDLATAYGSINSFTGGTYSIGDFSGGNNTDFTSVNITATGAFTTGYGEFNFTDSEINVAGLFSVGSDVNNLDNTTLNTGTGNAGTNDATALTMNGGGTLNVTNGSDVNIRGAVVNNVLNIDNSEVVITGDFDNQGSEVVDVSNGGTISVGGDFNNTGSGSVTAESGGVVQVDGDYTNTGGGTTTVDGGGIVIGGTYTGTAPTGDTESGCTGGSGGCCGAACSTLPVNLIDFGASLNKGEVIVSWSTASEENNDYFSLYQSLDGEDFLEIERVKGQGNATRVSKYERSFPLGVNSSEMVYFKLEQTDFDGTKKSLGLINVTTQNDRMSNSAGLELYPNPVASGNTVRLVIPEIVHNTWEIFDLRGNRQLVGNAEGRIISNLNLPAGIYIVCVKTDSQRFQQKLVVVE